MIFIGEELEHVFCELNVSGGRGIGWSCGTNVDVFGVGMDAVDRK